MKRLTIALLGLLVVSACGGDGKGPSAPAPAAIPNYTGIWTGSYTVTSCNQNGTIALANICGGLNGSLPFLLNIAQNGVTNGVNGTFNMGTVPFTIVPSVVASNGTLSFNGTSILSGGITVLVTWSLTTPITGTNSQIWSASGLTGQANLTGVIGSVTKTGSVDRQIGPAPRSLQELIRSVHGG